VSLIEQYESQDPSVGAELPRYRCHKEFFAVKIAKLEFSYGGPLHPDFKAGEDERTACFMLSDDPRYGVFKLPMDLTRNHEPKVGWYMVVYGDGLRNFAPPEEFENIFTRVE
jgi:hypothetical protein